MRETSKFWIDYELGNLEVLKARYIQHTFSPHFHEEYAIGIIVEGKQSTTYQHQIQTMPAGTVCVINPGELHTGHATNPDGWTYRMIYPDASVMQEVMSALIDKQSDLPFFPSLVIDDSHLFHQILNLHQQIENQHTTALEKESLLFNTLSHLIRFHADSREPMPYLMMGVPYLDRARDYIEAHYRENITLAQIADAVNISRYHLLRMFARHYGVSPHIYITNRRIQEAKKLLLSGMSIVDVAQKVGFVDQSHLTKRFKQITGITPARYH